MADPVDVITDTDTDAPALAAARAADAKGGERTVVLRVGVTPTGLPSELVAINSWGA